MVTMKLSRYGEEETGVLPGGTAVSKSRREKEPKSILDVDNSSGNAQRTSPRF